MTAPQQFLEAAREPDAQIQHLDRLFVRAVTSGAHPKITQHIIARRDATVRDWAKAWATKAVQP